MHNIYERELTVHKKFGIHYLNYLVVAFNDYIARFCIIRRPGVDQLIKSSSFHTSLFWSSSFLHSTKEFMDSCSTHGRQFMPHNN